MELSSKRSGGSTRKFDVGFWGGGGGGFGGGGGGGEKTAVRLKT